LPAILIQKILSGLFFTQRRVAYSDILPLSLYRFNQLL